jgi:protein gp37
MLQRLQKTFKANMAKAPKIRTERMWHPISCEIVGCEKCYETAKELGLRPKKQPHGVNLYLDVDELCQLFSWPNRQLVVVNPECDLFSKYATYDLVEELFDLMNEFTQHTFLLTTGDPKKVDFTQDRYKWTKNIFIGVSYDTDDALLRVEELRKVTLKNKFISCYSLSPGLANLDLSGISKVFVRSELSVGQHPAHEELLAKIKNNCAIQGVAFAHGNWDATDKINPGKLLTTKTIVSGITSSQNTTVF